MKPEVQDFGDSIVVCNAPKNVDPYDLLEYCDNVEREGNGQFRLDGVYAETKKKLIDILKGKAR